MAIVVVGGHSRNIGKTSIVCGLLKVFPEYRWTAIKITHHAHAEIGERVQPASEAGDTALSRDSSRYLAAGAVRSSCMRMDGDQAAIAMSRIQSEIAQSSNVVIESSSILGLLRPDLSLFVLDASVPDFKATAVQFLERADAILVSGGDPARPAWAGLAIKAGIPIVQAPRPGFWSEQAEQFIRARLASLALRSTSR